MRKLAGGLSWVLWQLEQHYNFLDDITSKNETFTLFFINLG